MTLPTTRRLFLAGVTRCIAPDEAVRAVKEVLETVGDTCPGC
jgi:hypothetical protein